MKNPIQTFHIRNVCVGYFIGNGENEEFDINANKEKITETTNLKKSTKIYWFSRYDLSISRSS
jgi:hypothetical protein